MKHINDKYKQPDINDKNNQLAINDKNKQQIPINDCWYKICCPEFNQCSQKKAGNNILVTGFYISTSRVELGNGQWLNPTPEGGSGYIIKYNTQWIVQWVRSIDLSFGFEITTDSANNVMVTGYYTSTTRVELGNGQWLKPTTNDGYKTSAFIIKYNSSGIVQWAKSIDANLGSFGSSITIDSTNNVLVIGKYSSTSRVELGNGQSLKPTNDTYNNPFIIKYNTQGIVQWARSLNQVNDSSINTGENEFSYSINTGGYGITIDSANNVLVTGNYKSKNRVELGNKQWLKPSSGVNNDNASVFIIKYNSSGIVQWAKSIDTNKGSNGFGITTDSVNNVLITGGYSSSNPVQLGNGQTLDTSPSNIPLTSKYNTTVYGSAYIIKYNSLGNVIWAKSIDANEISYGAGITTDSANNVLVTGSYISSIPVQLGNGQLLKSTPDSFNNPFIIKYNTLGIVQWAKSIDANNNASGYGITIDFANNVLVTGQYISTSRFEIGNGQLLNPTPEGGSTYIIKYNTQGIVQSSTSINTNSKSLGSGISS